MSDTSKKKPQGRRDSEGSESALIAELRATCGARDREIEVLRRENEQLKKRLESQTKALPGAEQTAKIAELILAHSPSGFTLYDSQRRVQFISPKGLEILGISSAAEVIGHTPAEFLGEPLAAQGKASMDLVFATGKPTEFESVGQRDGKTRYFRVLYNPLFDAAGKVEGILALFIDNTAHREIERGYEDLALRLEGILNSMSEMFTALDKDWKVTLMNRHFEEVTGYRREDALGKPLREAFPNVSPKIIPVLEKVMQNRAPERLDAYMDRLDAWFEVSVFPTPDGGIAVFALDVTESIKSREALEKSYERLRENEQLIEIIVEHSPSGLALYGKDQRIKFINRKGLEIIGKKYREDVIGHTTVEFLDRERYHQAKPHIQQVLKTGKQTEFELVRQQDGKAQYTRVVYCPQLGPDGKIESIVVQFFDNTEYRLLQDQIQTNAQRLEGILRSMFETFVSFDKDWKITLVNDRTLKLIGKEPEELVGWTVREALPDLNPKLYSALVEVMETRQARQLEYWSSWLSKWFESFIYPTPDGGAAVFSLDVTERVNSRIALEESYARLRESESLIKIIVDYSPSGLILYGKDMRARFINRKGLEIIGKAEPSEVVGHKPPQFMRPDWFEQVQPFLYRVYETGKPAELEALRQTDGQQRHIRVMYNPILGTDGKVENMVALFFDITERKQMEEQMRATAERLEGILRSMFEMFISFDKDWRITLANDQVLKLIGKEMHEVVGRTVQEAFPSLTSWLYPMLQEVMQTKTSRHLEHKPEWLDIWYEAFIYPTPDGGAAIFALDITERMKSRLALEESYFRLRESERLIEIIVENSPSGIALYDKDLRARFINRSGVEIIGKKYREDIIGHTPAEFLDHERYSRAKPYLQQILQTKKGVEFETIRRMGDKVQYYRVDYTPLLDSDRNLEGIVVQFFDITESKRLQAAVEQSLKEKETLLAEIHHRVKNNLAVISGLISIQAHSTDDMETKVALEETRSRIQSMSLIHEKLYESESFGSVDFCTYLRDLAANLKASFAPPDVEIEVVMNCDSVRLDLSTAITCGLLATEIITNIFKHAFKGRKYGRIEIGLVEAEKGYRLSIQDNGVGMPTAAEAKLAAEQRKGAASLGIRLIQGLARQLRGELVTTSAPGQGTLFELTFLGLKKNP